MFSFLNRGLGYLGSKSHSVWLAVITLIMLTVQVQWGLWRSLDLPTIDESWALVDGLRLARGDESTAIQLWNSPLYPILYSVTARLFTTLEATFYAQRLLLTILAVLALYALLARLLPSRVAWVGAAWYAVSAILVDLNFDRSDYLAAAILVWFSLSVADPHSPKRMLIALTIGCISAFFRPEYWLYVIGLLFVWSTYGLLRPDPITLRRRIPLALMVWVLGFISIGIAGVAVLARYPVVSDYFVWVFANNRATNLDGPGWVAPLWVLYERDYGPDRTILGIISHQNALLNDIKQNAILSLTLFKRLSTETTWGPVYLRAWRWVAGIILLASAGVWAMFRHDPSYWTKYWQQRARFWYLLAALLPLLISVLVLRPIPILTIVFAPLIIAPILIMLAALLRPFLSRQSLLFVGLIFFILLLSPNPRDFQGVQPVRGMVDYFMTAPTVSDELHLLGDMAITICPYLQLKGQPCLATRWTDEEGVYAIDNYLSKNEYDFLLVSSGMVYEESHEPSLNLIVNGQDNRWRRAAVFGDTIIFEYIG